eukprot:14670907-Alexandrium_andersonii.AAC.1
MQLSAIGRRIIVGPRRRTTKHSRLAIRQDEERRRGPGLNSVIRELVMMLFAYGVKKAARGRLAG